MSVYYLCNKTLTHLIFFLKKSLRPRSIHFNNVFSLEWFPLESGPCLPAGCKLSSAQTVCASSQQLVLQHGSYFNLPSTTQVNSVETLQMVKFYVSWGGGVCHGDFGNPKGPLLGAIPVLTHTAGLQIDKLKHTLGTRPARTHAAVRQFLPHHASSDFSSWDSI